MTANTSTYLLIADDSDEFQVALKYASHLAKANNAKVALLHVMDQEDFQGWGGIEERIHEEYKQEAESILQNAAKISEQISGKKADTYLEEGGRLDVILDIINKDHSIKKFILGGSTSTSSPGPLVSYFTGKGFVKLRVPLTIVPDKVGTEGLD